MPQGNGLKAYFCAVKSLQGARILIVSVVVLIALLGIQISWLIQMAQAKEQLFNEKAELVLSRTAIAICENRESCQNIGRCCRDNEMAKGPLEMPNAEHARIDSLLRWNMAQIGMDIPFSFELSQHSEAESEEEEALEQGKSVFQKRIEEIVSRNGVVLKLILPGRKAFVLQETGILFMSSVLLLLVVFYLFLMMLKQWKKEKELSQRTLDFLNIMAHEFKTPLTTMRLAVKTMLRSSKEDPDKLLQVLLNENKKLESQVERVLLMSAVEKNEWASKAQVIHADAVVSAAVDSMALRIQDCNASIDVQLMAGDALIKIDPNNLEAILRNLLENAMKYSTDKPRIEIRSQLEKHSYVLEIADQGIGIAPEFRERVLEPFYRIPGPNAEQVKGYGLGLTYVNQLVKFAGGTLNIQSHLPQGTRIQLQFPKCHEAEDSFS